MERLGEAYGGQKSEQVVGGLLGVIRYAIVLAVVLAYTAMIPTQSQTAGDIRQALLVDSSFGDATGAYWRRLATETAPKTPTKDPLATTTLAAVQVP